MSTRFQAGRIAPATGLGIVMLDAPASSAGDYTPGQSRGVQLQINPSVMESFTLIGFSVQVKMFAVLTTLAAVQYQARFGNLWAGLYVNSPLPNTDAAYSPTLGAVFPPDLSTFSKIWDGSSDAMRVYRNDGSAASLPAASHSTLVAGNYMLPAPIEIGPSSQVGFGLVLTPSYLSQFLNIWVLECTFSVLYSTRRLDWTAPPGER